MQLPKAGHTAAEIREWVGVILRLCDWKPSRLAQEARLAPSTLNRFMTGNGRHLLSSSTLGRIEEAACARIRERLADGDLSAVEYEAALAGPRGMVTVDEVDGGGKVVARWGFPEQWFRFTYGTAPDDCHIMRVPDDAMAPDLNADDRVIVDRRYRQPANDGAGLYAIQTTAGCTIRALEPTPDGQLRVSPRNKAFEAYTSRPGRLQVVGRIAGMWRRLSSWVPAAMTAFTLL